MRLRFDARTRAVFRRVPVVNVYSLAELLLIGALAIQSARLVWTIATPVAPLGDWRPAQPAIPAAPGDILRGFDPFFRLSGGQASGPTVVTSLQLRLFGTRIDETTGRGSAIIAGADEVQQSVAVGGEITPGVRLKSVAFDHVTIDRNGVEETLFLDQSDGVQPSPGGITTGPVGPVMSVGAAPGSTSATVAQLQADIGFVPRIDDGRISGLVVRPQGSGAAFRVAGLREGDIITSIGGRPVTGQGDIDRIAADFGGGGNLPITIERAGQVQSLAVAIAPR